MRVVVGLGNPERRYARTRHNLGFRVVDALAARHGLSPAQKLSKGVLFSGELEGQSFCALKPTTYMNLSGQAVLEVVRRLELDAATDLFVVCDDVNLPLGSCRARQEGSCGGHNGLRSIEEKLGSPQFARLRLGVADAEMGRMPLEDYVLQEFPAEQEPVVEELVAHAADACRVWLLEGIDAVVGRFNRRTALESEE